MLGLPSAPRPCPPSMLPIMLPRPASLNMPCMLLGPISPPIKPPIIRGMPPELPGTSLMISKPGSSPAFVLRSLERNRRSVDEEASSCLQGCHWIYPINICVFWLLCFFFFQSRTRYGLNSKIQSFDILPEIAHLPPHIFFAVTVDKGIPFGVPGYFSIEQSVALWKLQKVCGHIIYP